MKYGDYNFTWTQGTKLSTVTGTNIDKYRYSYDENGIRYKKERLGASGNVLGTTKYYLDGARIIAEDFEGTLIKYYYDSSGVSGLQYNGAYYYFVKDEFGNVLKIKNSSHSLVAQYEYDAWGNCTVISSTGQLSAINPFRYRGYYMDRETGFYYLQTRYYDPQVRRFISADNIELLPMLAQNLGELNLYSYCNNNPVMMTDSTGESILVSMLIGAGIGFLIEFIGDWADDGRVFNGSKGWQDYAGSMVAGFIGGAGTGLISTMAFSGVGDVVGGLMSGKITSFGQALGVFAISAAVAGVGYGLAKGMQHALAKAKYNKIIGTSTSNISINKKLTQAGLTGVKIGRDGLGGVLGAIKKQSFRYLDDGISVLYDLIYGSATEIFA